MKYIFGFLITLNLCCSAAAAHVSLAKIDSAAYEISIEKISAAITADNTQQETLQFDSSQSFLLKDHDQRRIGFLVPVKFNSKSYKNTICRLYFLDLHNNFRFAELFAEKNEEEDIVPSCVGIEAVAVQDNSESEIFLLTIVRYRTVNTYGSKAVILAIKNGALLYRKNINNCINDQGATTNIKSLKKKMMPCVESSRKGASFLSR